MTSNTILTGMSFPSRGNDDRRNPEATQKNSRGFTLVEMLVSIAILGVLSLLLMGMLSQVGKTFGQVQQQIDTRQTARAVLALMASDVRVAALPKERNMTGGLNYNLQFLVDPSALTVNVSDTSGGTKCYMYPHAFFWQAPIATDNLSLGNMAEVGYFIRWDTTTNPSNPRAMLCRYFVNPTDTTNYRIYSNPTAWVTTTAADSTGANTATAAPGSLDTVAPLPVGAINKGYSQPYKGWLADNVIGLWVRCLDGYGNPIVSCATLTGTTFKGTASTLNFYTYDSRRGYVTGIQEPNFSLGVCTPGGTQWTVAKAGTTDKANSPLSPTFCLWTTLPPTVEIAIVVLDSQTASRITSISASGPTSFIASGAGSIYNVLPSGSQATVNPGNLSGAIPSPCLYLNPQNFWPEINAFIKKLPTAIQKGARIYSTRVQLANGD